jgi:hypothetical protein
VLEDKTISADTGELAEVSLAVYNPLFFSE